MKGNLFEKHKETCAVCRHRPYDPCPVGRSLIKEGADEAKRILTRMAQGFMEGIVALEEEKHQP